MTFIEIILIAFGLAMDSFAVSISAAATGMINNRRAVFRIAFHFGLFQAMLPVLGWFFGMYLEPLTGSLSHYIAVALLIFIGIRMVREGLGDEVQRFTRDPSRGSRMVLLSVATSIDAFAIGFSMAMLSVDIWYPVLIIGIITSLVSVTGIFLGRMLHAYFGQRMEIIGGGILILIALRIFIESFF